MLNAGTKVLQADDREIAIEMEYTALKAAYDHGYSRGKMVGAYQGVAAILVGIVASEVWHRFF